MTSPIPVTAPMPSYNDEIDLSPLFQQHNALPDFLKEIDEVLEEMRKDRENIGQFLVEYTSEMNEKLASFQIALDAKRAEIEKINATHRQKDQASQNKFNALHSEYRSAKNINFLNMSYFKETIDRITNVIADAAEFINSIAGTVNNANENDSHERAKTIVEISLCESDNEATITEREMNHNEPVNPEPTNDQPNDVGQNTSNLTNDEEPVDAEKENFAPQDHAPETEPAQDDDDGKGNKPHLCKWCHEIVPKKMLALHRLKIHNIPPKSGKATVKTDRSLKRKISNGNESDDDASVTSGKWQPLRVRPQTFVKPKKLKKMVTSSPV